MRIPRHRPRGHSSFPNPASSSTLLRPSIPPSRVSPLTLPTSLLNLKTTSQSRIPSSEPRQLSWRSHLRATSTRPGSNTVSWLTVGTARNWTISSRPFKNSSPQFRRDTRRVRNTEFPISWSHLSLYVSPCLQNRRKPTRIFTVDSNIQVRKTRSIPLDEREFGKSRARCALRTGIRQVQGVPRQA
jgi:hypothetical protein